MSNSNQDSKETDDVLEQNITSLLSNAKTPPQMSDVGRARVRAALLAKHAAAPTRNRRGWIAGGAALTAAASVAVWYGTQPRSGAPTPGSGSAGPTAVASASGDMQKFADGSVVWLRDGAKVTELGPRHVKIVGEALFDVSPGTVPFAVDSAAAKIAVLGTRFVVAATADETSAAVIRGVVTLGNAQGDVTLHAGDQGRATAHAVPVRGPAPRLSQLVGWAQAARARDERGLRTAARNGTLYARLPNSQGQESPLPMTALHIDAVVENRIARVALDQTFLNPQPYEQEGMYRFAIPSDAALQRFAMYVDGTLTESVVTDRMRARRVYEDLVYRRIDPGLLEYAGEGRLEMKVYPLRANAEKRLAVVYTQSLAQLYDTWSLRVPIPDVDQAIEQVDFAVRIADCANCEVRSTSHQINVAQQGADAMVSYSAKNVQAGDSLVLQVRDTRRQPTVATATDSHGEYLMVRAPLPMKANAAPVAYVPRTWVVLNDVSASRTAMDRRAQAAIIDRALQEIDEDDQVAVLSFDVAARVSLPMVKVRAADRKKLAEVLLKQETGGVGATDMGVALAAALTQFDQHAAGQPASTRMLMYIGDGVLTAGERQLDALRTKVTGQAQFVGIGVGTGVDLANLQGLAAATDGYATEMDLSDDLSWRTFDVVAALHTTRIAQVQATAVDAQGAPLANMVGYVRSAQLAEGEEIEWVGKRANGPVNTTSAPVALLLQGVQAGVPWIMRVELAASENRTIVNAGYLPRLWAQRHIAARMLAKQAPAPECPRVTRGGRMPSCPSEAQRRETRDEGIRQEVVALGKEYFLLSRHTSLLVLEPGAGDRTNTVQGTGQTWATYAMPAKITVKTRSNTQVSAPPPVVTADGALWRQAVPVFALGSTLQMDLQQIESGAGIGQGFGRRGWGAGGGGATRASSAAQADLEDLRQQLPGPPPVTGNAYSEPEKDVVATSAPVPAEAVATQGTVSIGDATEAKAKRESSGGLFADDRDDQMGKMGLGHLGTISIAGERQWGGSGGYLQRYLSRNDSLFDDLTEYVPAGMVDGLSYWQRWLRAQRGDDSKATLQRDPAALALLAQARQALPPGTYQWGAHQVSIDAAGHLGWQSTTGFGLAEQALYDGHRVQHRYNELQLQFERTLAPNSIDEMALALGNLPIWLGSAATFAPNLSVTSPAPNQVAFAWPGAKPAVVYEFDSQHRVIAVRDRYGAMLQITWNDRGPVAATRMGERVAVGLLSTAVPDAAAAIAWAPTSNAAMIGLPLLQPAQHAAAAAKATVGSDAWQVAQRQFLLATAAQSGAVGESVWATLDALLAQHALTLGDLVLASGGLRGASEARWQTWLQAVAPLARAVPQCGILGPPCMLGSVLHDPENKLAQPDLVAYLVARRSKQPAGLAAASGLLTSLNQLAKVSGANTRLRLATVQAIPANAPVARLVAATVAQQDYRSSAKEVAAMWDAIAQGDNRNRARYQAALIWSRNGGTAGYNEAAKRLMAYMSDIDVAAPIPAPDYQAYSVMAYSSRGAAGWQLAWAGMRDRVLAQGDLPAVMNLLTAWSSGAAGLSDADRARVLERAWPLAAGHPATVLPLLVRAAMANASPWALTRLESVLPQLGDAPMIQRFASNLYAMQQQPSKAREHLELALAAEGETAVPLTQLRTDYVNLLAWTSSESASMALTKAAAQQRMIQLAQQWRAVDPANPAIDSIVANDLFAVGADAEAWRQLSTAIERQPMAATGWVMAAQAYEQHAKIAEAIAFWHEAVILDQTNPRWRIRQAQALMASGQTDAGKALLRATLAQRWHQQYEWEIEDARYILNPGSYR